MKSYFAYPELQSGNSDITIIEGSGVDIRETRMDADLKVEQAMDLSMMSTILVSENTAKDGLNKYLDVFYRDPSNSITAFLVLVEGNVKDYMEAVNLGPQRQANSLHDLFEVRKQSRSYQIGRYKPLQQSFIRMGWI